MTGDEERNVSVLLVEDSASDAELLLETLRETAGDLFQVTVLERLNEALRQLKTNSFDVLLLDLSLPDSAGMETFRAARAGAPHVPIVLLTGVDDEAVGVEAMRQGIQDYLVKGRADGPQIARAIRYAIERKRSEEALRRMEERLRQIQKLESLGVLAGGIAHDFNNLLTITLGHTELALAEAAARFARASPFAAGFDSTQRAAELSRQMLAYSGKQPLALEPLSLSGLVEKASRMLEVSVSRNARLNYQLAEDLPPVLGDATQMSQAMMNLVLNASEAIGERQGTITFAHAPGNAIGPPWTPSRWIGSCPKGSMFASKCRIPAAAWTARPWPRRLILSSPLNSSAGDLGLRSCKALFAGIREQLWWKANREKARPSASSCRRPRCRRGWKARKFRPSASRRGRHGAFCRGRRVGAGVGHAASQPPGFLGVAGRRWTGSSGTLPGASARDCVRDARFGHAAHGWRRGAPAAAPSATRPACDHLQRLR